MKNGGHGFLYLYKGVMLVLLGAFKPVFRLYYRLQSRYRALMIRSGSSTSVVERPHEYGFVLGHLPCGDDLRILDVGTGSTAFGAMLMNCNYRVDCLENTKYRRGRLPLNSHCNLVAGDIVEDEFPESQYDAVTCISVLEHIEQYDLAVANMIRTLKPGGVLILTFPYNDKQFIDDCYKQKESNRYDRPAPYICNAYSRREVERWCAATGAVVEKQIYGHLWTGPFWNSGEWTGSRVAIVSRDEKHEHCCLVLKKPARQDNAES